MGLRWGDWYSIVSSTPPRLCADSVKSRDLLCSTFNVLALAGVSISLRQCE